MTIEKNEVENTISKYRKLYTKFGYSPKSLGWDKGRQDIRFESLLSFFDCRNKSILDIGCGFGDLNRILQKLYGSEYSYVGLDLVDEFIKEARHRISCQAERDRRRRRGPHHRRVLHRQG